MEVGLVLEFGVAASSSRRPSSSSRQIIVVLCSLVQENIEWLKRNCVCVLFAALHSPFCFSVVRAQVLRRVDFGQVDRCSAPEDAVDPVIWNL